MEIENWPIGEIRPYPNNPRSNDRAVGKVAASIQEFGWRQPIVVDEDGIILVGHTRLRAAELLGYDEAPVHRAVDLTDDQKRAYRLADNRTAEYATWDEVMLGEEMRALGQIDLTLTGFSPGQIRKYTDDNPEEQPVTPAHVAEERCAPGHLWTLGEHRLKIGDATCAEDVKHALGEHCPGLMITDPPYGVEYDPICRHGDWSIKPSMALRGDDRSDWREAWVLFPGVVAYVWHADKQADIACFSLKAVGFSVRCQVIWVKPDPVMSRGHYHWQHEACWYMTRPHGTGGYGVKKHSNAQWAGSRNETTLWEVTPDEFDTDHPTQKPVECMLRAMRNHEFKTVYDPFLGTGTTIIAAEHEGRRCVGLELEPRWGDVILERWERFTGGKAERE